MKFFNVSIVFPGDAGEIPIVLSASKISNILSIRYVTSDVTDETFDVSDDDGTVPLVPPHIPPSALILVGGGWISGNAGCFSGNSISTSLEEGVEDDDLTKHFFELL